MKRNLSQSSQAGLVSIFTVLFFSLLITVVTVGYMRVMLQEQSQSIDNSLSQNAYDAAVSGVEDGKRAIAKYRAACEDATKASLCNEYRAAFDSKKCDALWSNEYRQVKDSMALVMDTDTNEVVLGDDDEMQLRYSCLNINMDTAAYTDNLTHGESQIIPIGGASNGANAVQLRWFNAEDRGGDNPASSPRSPLLPQLDEWTDDGEFTPPMMRVQLLQAPISNFKLEGANSLDKFARTIFLHPSITAGKNEHNFSFTDPRPDPQQKLSDYYTRPGAPTSPETVKCDSSADIDYSCSVTLTMNDGVLNPAINGRDAYLRVTPLYAGTTFELQPLNGSSAVPLKGIQPQIDVTARANNLFRRVNAMVGYNASGFQSGMTVNQLCKDMIVTSNPDQFTDTCGENNLTSDVEPDAEFIVGTDDDNSPSGGGRPEESYRRWFTIKTASKAIASCKWEWGDGEVEIIDNDKCELNTPIRHDFPDKTGCKIYNVRLTLSFVGGGTHSPPDQAARVPHGTEVNC